MGIFTHNRLFTICILECYVATCQLYYNGPDTKQRNANLSWNAPTLGLQGELG